MGAASIFTAAIAILMALFLVGLLVLFAGLTKKATDEQMVHLDRLSPSSQRIVRLQHWAIRNLPIPFFAGYLGAHLFGFGMMAMDNSIDGLPLRIFFIPTWIVEQLFAVGIPRLSLYFWGIVIAAAVFHWRQRNRTGPWTVAVPGAG